MRGKNIQRHYKITTKATEKGILVKNRHEETVTLLIPKTNHTFFCK